jgi:hypothetical protein
VCQSMPRLLTLLTTEQNLWNRRGWLWTLLWWDLVKSLSSVTVTPRSPTTKCHRFSSNIRDSTQSLVNTLQKCTKAASLPLTSKPESIWRTSD